MQSEPRRRRASGLLVRVTYPLLAELTGLSEATVRSYAQGKARRFNPRSLASIARFLTARGA